MRDLYREVKLRHFNFLVPTVNKRIIHCIDRENDIEPICLARKREIEVSSDEFSIFMVKT